MDQRRFDFSQHDSHPRYRQLNPADQQALIDLMSQLIIAVYQTPESTHHEQATPPKQD